MLYDMKQRILLSEKVIRGDQNTVSVVLYLDSIGHNSNYSTREALALSFGIDDYKGTSDQNTELLYKIRKKVNDQNAIGKWLLLI